ncbi:hypothetical protein BpHYR1_020586 [Brachionus plicatilis]|uniref:Uncharacterized protein n=1 Tax=Brachionus plicatilis TaxID=10195 RepID=A0A3M7QZ02_BRAPC|nr:hypothetical protein BpHYR1_020586 [Brachionus plicatilis]
MAALTPKRENFYSGDLIKGFYHNIRVQSFIQTKYRKLVFTTLRVKPKSNLFSYRDDYIKIP